MHQLKVLKRGSGRLSGGANNILQLNARCIHNYSTRYSSSHNYYLSGGYGYSNSNSNFRKRQCNFNFGNYDGGSGILGDVYYLQPQQSLFLRLIHSSSNSMGDADSSGAGPGKPSSKVEQTVKILEKELEKSKELPPAKRPLYKRIQDEVRR